MREVAIGLRTAKPYNRAPENGLDGRLFARYFWQPNMGPDPKSGGALRAQDTPTLRRKRLDALMSDAINPNLPLERSLGAVSRLKAENAITELKKVAKNQKTPLEVGLKALHTLYELGNTWALARISMAKSTPEQIKKTAKYLCDLHDAYEPGF
jgi:hypothetical protein